MQERKLTKPEAKAKERIVKDLKGAKADFKKRYGDDAEAVMYATATKRAKKIAEADLGTVEPIVSALILIFGSVGIKVGFDQLIKLTDKYVAPIIDRIYGKVGAGAEFTRKHLKTLYSAYTQGKEVLKDKVIELLNISNLNEEGCGCSVCQEELKEKKKKRDRCLRIADRKFEKPSAYKSGAVVRCRQGKIWKNVKEFYTQLDEKEKETLRTWFKRKGAPGKTGGWVDCNSPIRKDGKIVGYKPCGRQKGEKRAKYPSCRPTPAGCKDPGKGKSWGKTK